MAYTLIDFYARNQYFFHLTNPLPERGQVLGDDLTAALGPSTAEHFPAVSRGHALAKSVLFFPYDLGRCF